MLSRHLRVPAAVLGLTTLFSACGDELTRPDRADLSPILADPSFTILDGAFGGNTRFYFLPPLVPEPTYSGTFDAAQSPMVSICELSGTTCGATIATFSGSAIEVDLRKEAYVTRWKLKDSGLDPAKQYRIQILIGTTMLGYADVVVVSNGSQIKSVDRTQFVATMDHGVLQIRFRIERATPPACTPGTPGCGWQNGDLITYTQDSWGGDPTTTAGAALLVSQFGIYAPSGGVEVGSSGAAAFSMIFTSAAAVLAYLPATGGAAPLSADVVDPLSSASGVFGGFTLALELNVDFADAGLLGGTSGIAFGNLRLCGLTTFPLLNGLTVRQVLGIAEQSLGGGGGPYSPDDLAVVAQDLAAAFVNGTPSSFAQQHLLNGACPQSNRWQNGDVITHSALSWGETILPGGARLVANYNAVYASTAGLVETGIPGSAGFSMIFTSSGAVLAYLPPTGPAGALNADLIDPLSSASGVFGGEVLALRFNIDFSEAGYTLGTSGIRFGDLKLCGFAGALAGLNGLSIRAFSGIANTGLAGGSTPYTVADLDFATFHINNAFSGGVPNTFAQQHLFNDACPAS